MSVPLSERQPAGFWIRAGGAVVDLGLFFVVQFSLGFFATLLWGPEVEDSSRFQLVIVLFTLLFTAVYTTALHAAGGQTLGKMVVGVCVLGADGEPLGVGAALLRYFAYFVSLAPLGLGFVMAGLRRDKRTLHDLLAGSRVVSPGRARAVAPETTVGPGVG